jgi:hypothetical protein
METTRSTIRAHPLLPPINPLKQMRLRLNWTLDHTADLLSSTRQFVIRAEQGVYADPPPRLLSLLLSYTEPELFIYSGYPATPINNPAAVGDVESEEALVYHQYHVFQSLTRKRNYGRLLPVWRFDAISAEHHPFLRWRLASGVDSRISISKFYCVHPALITKFENSPHLVSHPPTDLISALTESGYDSELLDSLATAYDNYKAYLSDEFKKQQGIESDRARE